MTTAPALAELTTIRVGGPPASYLRASSEREVVDAAVTAWAEHDRWFVLGGGSNVVAPDADDRGVGFDGAVVHVVSRGVERLAPLGHGDDAVRLRVQAGEPWDALVALAVAEGWAGIEALSGIPGSVGAAPVQNIGAYGQEVASVLVAVDFLDAETGTVQRVPAEALGLGYRTSAIKRGRAGVVIAVEIELSGGGVRGGAGAGGAGASGAGAVGVVGYAQLADALGVAIGARAPIAEIRAAVLALRAGKGMVLDPADPASVSCGSFFVNPIVPERVARGLPSSAPQWPVDPDEPDLVVPLGAEPAHRAFAQDRRVKLSAAWLIERAGIPRGFTLPGIRAGISPKHTLAIVNLGGALADDVLGMATYVQTRVASEFGIVLEPEPVVLD